MQTKFKRHQNVILLENPDKEYVEYHNIGEDLDESHMGPITKGMKGKINMILPNGKYHVEILNNENKTVAYVVIDEEQLIAE